MANPFQITRADWYDAREAPGAVSVVSFSVSFTCLQWRARARPSNKE